MKKLATIIIAMIIPLCGAAHAIDNTIYEADIKKTGEGAFLSLKSDYKEPLKTVKTPDGVTYFELNNTRLSKDFKINSNSNLGLVAQQIGKKTRFYAGEKNMPIEANLIANKGQKPFDPLNLIFISGFFAFVAFVAIKYCSATIELATYENSIKFPIKGENVLNKMLYDFNHKPEIVYSRMNPEKSEIVDFNLAKNKKNVKIAI